jgi:hypothetical protein
MMSDLHTNPCCCCCCCRPQDVVLPHGWL